MNILEYVNGKDSLDKKEKVVIDTIDILDRESFNLFGEIIDLSDESYYKVMQLFERTNVLLNMYRDTNIAYDKLCKCEANDFSYVTRKYQLRKLLLSYTTILAFLANALLGIISFVILSKKANKIYAEDLMDIYNSILSFDDEKMKKIVSTLENCTRLLHGRTASMLKHFNENKGNVKETLSIMVSNDVIRDYINGKIDYGNIEFMSTDIKDIITRILKHDLNSDSNDLHYLLEETKERETSCFKLINDYRND